MCEQIWGEAGKRSSVSLPWAAQAGEGAEPLPKNSGAPTDLQAPTAAWSWPIGKTEGGSLKGLFLAPLSSFSHPPCCLLSP